MLITFDYHIADRCPPLPQLHMTLEIHPIANRLSKVVYSCLLGSLFPGGELELTTQCNGINWDSAPRTGCTGKRNVDYDLQMVCFPFSFIAYNLWERSNGITCEILYNITYYVDSGHMMELHTWHHFICAIFNKFSIFTTPR